VKEIIFRAARRLQLDTVLVANQPMPIPANATTVSTVMVREGANIADRYIVAKSQPGDLAITADIPLAADLVAKGVDVIDPRGQQYTADNIRERLAMRDFMDQLRGAGVATSGAAPYSPQDKKSFAAALDRSLTRLTKQAARRPAE
jgi:uncharacterized protein YaiI (UPF0178 family)